MAIRVRRTALCRWVSGRLAGVWGLLILVCFPACGPSPSELPRPNILLITVDTLRADHLSSYGYVRPTSPVIDALAAEGVRFANASVQWPKTGPSFASMFTATYPKDNGIVRKVGIPLPGSFRMLAEVLREAGYGTHAVVANGAVGSEFGFAQGFDTYVESWKSESPIPGIENTAAAAVNALVEAVVSGLDRERPYFLWVHYVDPHTPYTPPGEWSDRFQADAHYSDEPRIPIDYDKHRQQMTGIGASQVLDGRDELGFYVARYDAEIAYADEQIGALRAFLAEQGLLDNTLTAFTSDHGESLGEHQYYFDHGRFGFQTTVHVPFFVHFPGVVEPRVDAEPVELIHLAPTLLEAAGVELDEGAWMQGRSLWPRLRGEEAPASLPYAFTEAGWGENRQWIRSVRDRRFKLTHARSRGDQRWIGGPGTAWTLYDLENDPGETQNVAEAFPRDFRRLRRELRRWWNQPSFAVEVDAGSAAPAREMDAETRRQLEALGYLQ